MKRRSVWLIAGLGLVVAGCGTDTPSDYGAENREAFMAACVDGDTDGIFQQRVCQCVYDEAEATIPFERFVEIEDALTDDEEAALPDDLVDVVARCVIEEGDL